MEAHMYTPDRLIYLDADFVSAKFEEETGKSPPTQLTRVEGMKAGANVSFLSAGVHTQETRTYNVSAHRMLKDVATTLQLYPAFDAQSFENYHGTTVCWMDGRFTLGEWKLKGEAQSSVECFELLQNGTRINLLLNSTYLTAGFDSMMTASEALKVNIAIPAKALARVMWRADRANSFVACPYVIVENRA